jgi:hypothetical protein
MYFAFRRYTSSLGTLASSSLPTLPRACAPPATLRQFPFASQQSTGIAASVRAPSPPDALSGTTTRYILSCRTLAATRLGPWICPGQGSRTGTPWKGSCRLGTPHSQRFGVVLFGADDGQGARRSCQIGSRRKAARDAVLLRRMVLIRLYTAICYSLSVSFCVLSPLALATGVGGRLACMGEGGGDSRPRVDGTSQFYRTMNLLNYSSTLNQKDKINNKNLDLVHLFWY